MPPEADDLYAAEADVYDLTTAAVSRLDVPFYRALAVDAGGPVLELGCGTGRVLLPCAEAAGAAAGVDTSPAMLARARARLAAAGLDGRVELHHADMRGARLGRSFPLVTIPFRSLFHLRTDRDWLAALATVRAHLATGGRFAADVFVPDPAATRTRRAVTDPGTGHRIAVLERIGYDTARQVATRRRVVEVLDPGGRVLDRRERLMPIHYRWPEQVLRLLARAGFTVEQAFGGFDGRPLDAAAEELIWVATARPG
jgi:SAM-dependent methyltransferase